MALIVSGTVSGRTKRHITGRDGTTGFDVVSIYVASEFATYVVEASGMAKEDAPAVGEVVALPVEVVPYQTKGGARHRLVLKREVQLQ